MPLSEPEKKRRAVKAAETFIEKHLRNAPGETLFDLQRVCCDMLKARARLRKWSVEDYLKSCGRRGTIE